jgi:glucan endo-1,3-alpha-glucosidase
MSDLVSYFVRAYKDGVPPAITKDEVFYFYRTQPLKVAARTPPVAHVYGPAADRIYVTANLTAPATLVVRSGDKSTTKELPAGSHDVEAPFVAGKAPEFELLRNGKRIAFGVGPSPIDPNPRYRNLYNATGVVE